MQDQDRSSDALRQKLAARRKQRLELEMARLERDAILNEEDESKREMLEKMKEQAEQRSSNMSDTVKSTTPTSTAFSAGGQNIDSGYQVY